MANFGTFSGNPKTEWITSPAVPDRDMALLEDFSYTDPSGKTWLAPRGSVVNGASIPRPLWAAVGSPYTDDYRRASIVHDVACADPAAFRKDADVMFYYACQAGGCPPLQAQLLYAGVRIGAWAGSFLPPDTFARANLLLSPPIRSAATDSEYIQNKFRDIALELEQASAPLLLDQVDAIVQKHINI